MVDFAKYTPSNDIDAGKDRVADAARTLVRQWRRLNLVVPCDAAYLIARMARTETRLAFGASEGPDAWEGEGFDYPAAARSIAVNLDEFCDNSQPFPRMIADAARAARLEIESLRRQLDAATSVSPD